LQSLWNKTVVKSQIYVPTACIDVYCITNKVRIAVKVILTFSFLCNHFLIHCQLKK
jgi:hypothetical protein